VKPPRAFSITLGILFLVPFCAIGVIAMVFSVLELVAGHGERGAFLLIFGFAFGGAGFGFLAALYFGRLRLLKEKEYRLRHPDAPWMWRDDWAEGKARTAGLPAVWTAWVFALVWSSISSSVVFFLPRELESDNLPALIALVFPLVGLWLIYRAVRLTVQRRRFGESTVRLDTVPGVTGGRLAGTLVIPSGFPPDAQMLLRLTCVNRWRTTGRNSTSGESIVWQEEMPPASVYSAGGAVTVPFTFEIPADTQPSVAGGSGTGILWRLSASARIPGVDFEADYDVPVFAAERGASGPASGTTSGSGPGAESGPVPDRWSRPASSVVASTRNADTRGLFPEGVSSRPASEGGTEFVFRRWRNGRAAFGLAAFTTLWSAFLAMTIMLGAPVIFPIVFGIFDLLLIWFIIHLWAGETRVTIDPTGITVHPRFPVLASLTVLPPGRIADVRLSIGMQSGNAVFYNLDLAGATGRSVTVPAFLRNKRDAERVAVLIRQTIQTTHNLRTEQ